MEVKQKFILDFKDKFEKKSESIKQSITRYESCKVEDDQPTKNSSKARLILSVMSALDEDVASAFLDTEFKSHLLHTKWKYSASHQGTVVLDESDQDLENLKVYNSFSLRNNNHLLWISCAPITQAAFVNVLGNWSVPRTYCFLRCSRRSPYISFSPFRSIR